MCMCLLFSVSGVSMASLDDSLKVYTTSVTVGNSVELKCDVKGLDRIIWKRKGHSIEGTVDKQIKVRVFRYLSVFLRSKLT